MRQNWPKLDEKKFSSTIEAEVLKFQTSAKKLTDTLIAKMKEVKKKKDKCLSDMANLKEFSKLTDEQKLQQPFHRVDFEYQNFCSSVQSDVKQDLEQFASEVKEQYRNCLETENAQRNLLQGLLTGYNEHLKNKQLTQFTPINLREEPLKSSLVLTDVEEKVKSFDENFQSLIENLQVLPPMDQTKQPLWKVVEPQRTEELLNDLVPRISAMLDRRPGSGPEGYLTPPQKDVKVSGAIDKNGVIEMKDSIKDVFDHSHFSLEFPAHTSQIAEGMNQNEIPQMNFPRTLVKDLIKQNTKTEGETKKEAIYIHVEGRFIQTKKRAEVNDGSDVKSVSDKRPELWQCIDDACDETFKSFSHLSLHFESEHQGKLFVCLYCANVKDDIEVINNCKKSHFPFTSKANKITNFCVLCMTKDKKLNAFNSEKHLIDHLANHDEVGECFACPFCDQKHKTVNARLLCQKDCMFEGAPFQCQNCKDGNEEEETVKEFESYRLKVEHFAKEHPKKMESLYLVETDPLKRKGKPGRAASPTPSTESLSARKPKKALTIRSVDGEKKMKELVCPKCRGYKMEGEERDNLLEKWSGHLKRMHGPKSDVKAPRWYVAQFVTDVEMEDHFSWIE